MFFLLQFLLLNSIVPNRGGNQLMFASVWESRNINTSAVATLAPANLALIRPLRSGKWTALTLVKFANRKSSKGFWLNSGNNKKDLIYI